MTDHTTHFDDAQSIDALDRAAQTNSRGQHFYWHITVGRALLTLEAERDELLSEHKFLNDLKNERTAERDALRLRVETDQEVLAAAERNIRALSDMAGGGDLGQPVSGHAIAVRDALAERNTLRLRVAALECYVATARKHLHSQDEQARTNATTLLDSAGDTTALRAMLVEAMHAGARAAIDGSLAPGEAEGMVAGYMGGVYKREGM